MPTESYLIVNADDFGYDPGVNRGIIESARRGIVTATGIFANAENLQEQVDMLRDIDHLDTGVHLNLTYGKPVAKGTLELTRAWGGSFPGKATLLRALATGKMGVEAVKTEWRAQIERCLASGVHVRFVNSHEHVHMLPGLFGVTRSLAREFGVPHVRVAVGEWRARPTVGSIARNALIDGMRMCIPSRSRDEAPIMIGLAASGRLSLPYLENTLKSLRKGGVYELMCHPGCTHGSLLKDPHLLHYHDWDGERMALCSDEAGHLCEEFGIRLIGYRHLAVVGGRLEVRRS